MTLQIAPWVADLPMEMAASLYSLRRRERVEGAVVAHQAGLWIHLDVIIVTDDAVGVRNVGVSAEEVREVLAAVPDARLDIHVISTLDAASCRPVVAGIREALRDTPATRWSGPGWLWDLLPDEGQRWQERWPGRDDPEPGGEPDGILMMLIEPGTRTTADPEVLRECGRLSAAEVRVGIDGGVTEAVAGAAAAVGVAYAVSGRALFIRRPESHGR